MPHQQIRGAEKPNKESVPELHYEREARIARMALRPPRVGHSTLKNSKLQLILPMFNQLDHMQYLNKVSNVITF